MPVQSDGFTLKPVGFFGGDPAIMIDIPITPMLPASFAVDLLMAQLPMGAVPVEAVPTEAVPMGTARREGP